MRDFASHNYSLLVGTGTGRGTWIIERQADSFTSLRATGTEGLEEYKRLRRIYGQGHPMHLQCFDDYIKENYEFTQ